MFAMLGATALGACSQSPAPIIRGAQIQDTPGSMVAQRVEPNRVVEVADVAPARATQNSPRYKRAPDWQDNADIGSDMDIEPIAPSLKVDAPVNAPVEPTVQKASITSDPDAYTQVSARVKPVKRPREKPLAESVASPQIAKIVPRSRPAAVQQEPATTNETLEIAETTPVVKTQPKVEETQNFVDIPIEPKQPVAQAEPETQVALNSPAKAPEIAVTRSKEVSFSWPVTGPVITRFGPTEDGKRNEGINIAVREGARVRAAEAGTVAYVGNELSGYGNLLLVRHESGYVTAYAHNKDLLVKKGDKVNKGDVIALAGMSGSVDEPQLHFEVRKGVNAVDPMKYLGRPGARS